MNIPFFKTGHAELDVERWFVTDFTKEQIEKRIAALETALTDERTARKQAEMVLRERVDYIAGFEAEAKAVLAALDEAERQVKALRVAREALETAQNAFKYQVQLCHDREAMFQDPKVWSIGRLLCKLGLHQPVVTKMGERVNGSWYSSAFGFCACCNKSYQWDHWGRT